MHNLLKGSVTIIGEWAGASDVERQGTHKAKPASGTNAQPPK